MPLTSAMHPPLHTFYSGTSGLVLPVPQSQYPPQFQGKSRLAYYASLFNSLEVNSSFYKQPKASTVLRWADEVPAGFRFTFKLPKAVTHARHLNFSHEDVSSFIQTTQGVGDKKGCLLIQLPPALASDKMEQLQRLLTCIKQHNANDWRLAVEFRNPSWYTTEVYTMLDDNRACMVMHDLPKSTAPVTPTQAGFRYLRFHGPGGRYRGSYTNEFLEEHAQRIKAWLSEGDVYAYFNNTMGAALGNLQSLQRYLAA